MSVHSVIRSDTLLGLGSPSDAVQRADTLADLPRIFMPEAQICVHSPPGSPNMLGALAGLRASGWSGLRVVVRLSAEGVPDIDALPLPPAFAHPALRREFAFLLELYGDLLDCRAIGLRIERLERAMCPRWHVDRTGTSGCSAPGAVRGRNGLTLPGSARQVCPAALQVSLQPGKPAPSTLCCSRAAPGRATRQAGRSTAPRWSRRFPSRGSSWPWMPSGTKPGRSNRRSLLSRHPQRAIHP